MGFSSCFGAFDFRRGKTVTVTEGINTNNVRLFSYHSLRSATRLFHPSNRIGRGGFGVVYKGVLRDGTQVAIKTLSAESKQGTDEFLTELNMISNIRHPNLVQLIGCCIEGNNRILVYEYLENNSLASALLASKGKCQELDWSKRAAICKGTASGLAFLHEDAEPRIVHRDIKASNVLLDENFLPKIGDFGLAKLFPDNVTHVSTRVAGTEGIEDGNGMSELGFCFNVSFSPFPMKGNKICVPDSSVSHYPSFSFFSHLPQGIPSSRTWKLFNEDRLLEIVDPDLIEYPQGEIMRFTKIALFCTQAASQQRPDMKQVVTMLFTDVSLNENILSEPGLYRPRNPRKPRDGSLQISSLSDKGKEAATPFMTSTQFDNAYTDTEMVPR
ncbi:UNVERIFIED_CONTAM: Cold-responsive protein kinase [Sesamum angustifolium]|uniref:non-specific serine/threonine protein kinase n=1 Tax=Sesamum angustifolium TaxID=2727405 RepID=A0AAW2N5T5_9LAMI